MSDDVQAKRIGDFIEADSGAAFSSEQFGDAGVPLVRIRDLANQNPEVQFGGDYDPKYLIKDGDILVGMDGEFNAVEWAEGRALLNQRVCRIRVVEDGLEQRFLLHSLQPELESIQRVTPQTTVKHLSLTTVRNIQIWAPEVSKQRYIADILDTVDRAIRKTEEVIGKLEEVERGLLYDLMTNGLSEGGQIRDDRTGYFQESPLGSIPSAWECVRLGDVIVDTEYGLSDPLTDDPSGTPILRMNNFENGEVDLSDLRYSKSDRVREFLLQPGDVLYNRTNSIEHVGRTGIWRGQLKRATFASYLVRLHPETSRLSNEYLNLWLNRPESQVRMKRYATHGVSQVNLNPTNLQRLWINLPPLEEQKRIVATWRDVRTSIVQNRVTRDKLSRLKEGLSADLLSEAGSR